AERPAPGRCERAGTPPTTPQGGGPAAPQGRSPPGPPPRPPAELYAASRSPTTPKPPTRGSVRPNRHDFTHSQPRSSTGSPRCASSQSSTARIPSGPTTRFPLRKSPWTSSGRGGAGGGGAGGPRDTGSEAGGGAAERAREARGGSGRVA